MMGKSDDYHYFSALHDAEKPKRAKPAMTQPDKWNDTAFYLFAGKSVMVDEPGMIEAAATALRSAYAEGEKAGMERAAVMATGQANLFRNEAHDQKQWGHREMHKRALMIASFFDSHATAIRAAKETKE